mgnify:CR=1 FL=1
MSSPTLLRYCLCLVVLLISRSAAMAQTSDTEAVRQAIDRLFDGMRAGDSAAVARVFMPHAQLGTLSGQTAPDRISQ